MSNQALLQKADLALANLVSDGGLLNAIQSDRFLDELIDGNPVLKLARTVPMNGPTMEISAIGFGTRVTRPGAEATALSASDYAVPGIRTISLSSKLYKAQTQMTYEVLEDNIARGTLEQTVISAFVKAVSRDMEELILRGDTGSGDAYLATMNGVPKKITSNIVSAASSGNTLLTYNNVLNALPERFKNDMSKYRFIVPPSVEQNYRYAVAQRQTTQGDTYGAALTTASPMGVDMMRATFMPTATGMLIDPFNIIVGIQRAVRIESDRDIEKGLLKWVISFRMDMQLENQLAAVKITNLS